MTATEVLLFWSHFIGVCCAFDGMASLQKHVGALVLSNEQDSAKDFHGGFVLNFSLTKVWENPVATFVKQSVSSKGKSARN